MADSNAVVKILFSILWLILLIFIAFPIAGFCAGWYILFQPFSVCIEGCAPIQDLLLKAVGLPRMFTVAMMGGKSFSEAAA